jgi:hypothetical protein
LRHFENTDPEAEMKRLIGIVILVGAVAVVPAQGGPPPGEEIGRLKRQVATLQARLGTLTRGNQQLTTTNVQLRGRVKTLEVESAGLRRHIRSASGCAATPPNGSTPPGETRSAQHHGGSGLWVNLWPDGVIAVGSNYQRPDGSIGMKFPWWRSVIGDLKISGTRLDAAAPPLRAEIPSGYGDSGFQASGVIFPTDGCWEVTGKAGSAALTFVVLVLRV